METTKKDYYTNSEKNIDSEKNIRTKQKNEKVELKIKIQEVTNAMEMMKSIIYVTET